MENWEIGNKNFLQIAILLVSSRFKHDLMHWSLRVSGGRKNCAEFAKTNWVEIFCEGEREKCDLKLNFLKIWKLWIFIYLEKFIRIFKIIWKNQKKYFFYFFVYIFRVMVLKFAKFLKPFIFQGLKSLKTQALKTFKF